MEPRQDAVDAGQNRRDLILIKAVFTAVPQS